MPRRPRGDAAGAIHHVVARGNGGDPIVMDDADREAFVDLLGRVVRDFGWRVHAYCLMANHVHLVVETPVPTLGVGMQRLVGGHAFRFNRRHGRSGHLFMGPYYAADIDDEAHLIESCVYVVLNPVRAGLVRRAHEWRWSSYRVSAGFAVAPAFVAADVIPGALSPHPERARELYRLMVDDVARRDAVGSG